MNEKEKELTSIIALESAMKGTNSPRKYYETVPCPPIPTEFESPMAYLRHLTHEGLMQRFGSSPSAAATERMNRELDLIEKKGWQDYFLFIWDLIKTAQDTIPSFFSVSCQGYASYSFVNYLLQITLVNPLDFHLPEVSFMRDTLNVFPNIPLLINETCYPDFLNMMNQKYGRQVAHTYTMFFFQKKQSYHIHNTFVWAIADRELDQLMPMIEIYDNKKQEYVLCPIYDYMHISEHGAKKQHICDFRFTDTITKVLAELNIFYADKQKFLNEIPLNDLETLHSFHFLDNKDKKAILGSLSSSWNKLLSEFPLDSFQDLCVFRALKCCIHGETRAQEYICRKKEGIIPTYIIPEMASVLDETYGVLVYDVQVTQLAEVISSMDTQDAHAMQRAIRQKKTQRLREFFYPKFLEGGIRNGYTLQQLDGLYQMIYSTHTWVKAHSLTYTLLEYWTAYLRVHYPVAWQKAHQKEEQSTK